MPFTKGDHYAIVYCDAHGRMSIRVVRFDGPSRWWDWGMNSRRSFLSKRIQIWRKIRTRDIPKAVHLFYGFGGGVKYYKAA